MSIPDEVTQALLEMSVELRAAFVVALRGALADPAPYEVHPDEPFLAYEMSPSVERVLDQAYEAGLIVPFDWVAWIDGRAMTEIIIDTDASALALLTAIVRADRFSDGTLASAFDNGTMRRILEQLAGE